MRSLHSPLLRLMVFSLPLALAGPMFAKEPVYLGAKAVLAEAKGKEALKKEVPWSERLGAYNPAALSPQAAATEWLEILEASWKRGGEFDYDGDPGDAILRALPPPAAWDALAELVRKRPAADAADTRQATRELGLRMLAETLVAGKEGSRRQWEAGRAALPSDVRSGVERQVRKGNFYNGDEWLAQWEKELPTPAGNEPVELPPILLGADAQKRDAFLLRLLKEPGYVVAEVRGRQFSEWAGALALRHLEEMATPQWGLAATPEQAALFEALEQKFPTPAKGGESNKLEELRLSAENAYIIHLIVEGKTEEAIKRASALLKQEKELDCPLSSVLQYGGQANAYFDFLDGVLTAYPAADLWKSYLETAVRVGKQKVALERVNALLAKKGMSKLLVAFHMGLKTRAELERALPEILLMLDDVEGGIAALQAVLAAGPLEGSSSARLSAATRLTRVGLLLERPELVEEGLAAARVEYDRSLRSTGGRFSYHSRLPGLLVKAGRAPEAEQVLANALKAAAPKEGEAYFNCYATQDLLMQLCAFYHTIGRPGDVVMLLDEGPLWGAGDLAQLLDKETSEFSSGRGELALGEVAADALWQTGNRAAASAIILNALESKPGRDAGYALLLRDRGAKALPELERLAALNPFEERPLIWKAQLLLDEGKLEEAEATVRKAIAIDPSDGEQGPGDRMRAYLILGKIREKRGDEKDAELFGNVMKAIRLSETADRYYEAGLLSRAAALYSESLGYFADAYCIQSRLARQLAELGRFDEAQAHYRRAYELMPVSFGRVESHCFGCESAFEGKPQQTIAEEVFTRLAKETPEKPQVHYLLGYLYEEQGRVPEALAAYWEATRLDPDYLNAWKRWLSLAAGGGAPSAAVDTAVLALIRLDPQGQHVSQEKWSQLDSPKLLWESVEAANAKRPQSPTALYPLKASQAFLAARPDAGVQPRQSRGETPQGIVLERLDFLAPLLK